MSKFSWAKFRYKSAFNSFSTTPPAAWVREGEFSLLPPPPTLNNLKENQLLGMGAREGGFSPTPNPLRVLSQINSPGRQWGGRDFPYSIPSLKILLIFYILLATGEDCEQAFHLWRAKQAARGTRVSFCVLLLCDFSWVPRIVVSGHQGTKGELAHRLLVGSVSSICDPSACTCSTGHHHNASPPA